VKPAAKVIFEKRRPDARSESVRSAPGFFLFFRYRGGHPAAADAKVNGLVQDKE
jgi:hypothetical protein